LYHFCLRARPALSSTEEDRDAYLRHAHPAGLTDKQREVLDLLIEHKTSKEIGRALGISPHTVDQRLMFARDKLGARNRGELAAAYRELIMPTRQATYGLSHIDPSRETGDVATPSRGARHAEHSAGPDRSIPRPEARGRVGLIVVLAVLAILVLIAAHAAYHAMMG